MSDALKNRLVGTIILVALAVIFLPDLLDGKKEARAPLFESIPSVPEKKPIVHPEPFPTDRVKQAAQRPVEIVDESAQDNYVDNSSTAIDAASQSSNKPKALQDISAQDLAAQTVIEKPDPAQSGAGWVIQLGSFRYQKNVRLLLDKLERAGYRAFSQPIKTQSGTLTKVFVGPDLQRQKLQAALPHLKELTGLTGKVSHFTVQP